MTIPKNSSAKRTTVKIPTASGDAIEAWVYRPEGSGPHPAVVMAHGIGGIKAGGLAPFAERFRDEGFAAIAFDYRNFGGSGGQPREALSVPRQRADYSTVIGWASEQPYIDSRQIFVWGTSFAGMHVVETRCVGHSTRRSDRAGATHGRLGCGDDDSAENADPTFRTGAARPPRLPVRSRSNLPSGSWKARGAVHRGHAGRPFRGSHDPERWDRDGTTGWLRDRCSASPGVDPCDALPPCVSPSCSSSPRQIASPPSQLRSRSPAKRRERNCSAAPVAPRRIRRRSGPLRRATRRTRISPPAC